MKVNKPLGLFVAVIMTVIPQVSWSQVTDDAESRLIYNSDGIKAVFDDADNVAKIIRHHVRAFVAKDAQEVAKDYKINSTLTFGPGANIGGETFDIVGRNAIRETFESFFNGGLPDFYYMSITSASKIGEQFYQTFELTGGHGPVVCMGTDTFLVTGNTIANQTAYIICP